MCYNQRLRSKVSNARRNILEVFKSINEWYISSFLLNLFDNLIIFNLFQILLTYATSISTLIQQISKIVI